MTQITLVLFWAVSIFKVYYNISVFIPDKVSLLIVDILLYDKSIPSIDGVDSNRPGVRFWIWLPSRAMYFSLGIRTNVWRGTVWIWFPDSSRTCRFGNSRKSSGRRLWSLLYLKRNTNRVKFNDLRNITGKSLVRANYSVKLSQD